MAATCQAKARDENTMNYLARSGSNVKIEEQIKVVRLSKEALKEISLLEWPFSMESVQIVQMDL